ncbi:unnamed protein product [Rotaria sordida]|uniref:Sodium-coupled monocarboxylate transporter 1 n=1 Tax=Rotaria sordida TaxID=392033 RepID=A0A815GHU2_9BILA|nr:unnamed protein product [Rotaria sordida]CAF3743113.1 unnamed protein product [Rotaria sordida]
MYLGWIDYGVLVILLGLSAIIGIYHGCIRSKQLSTKEFLIADGQMKVLPTAMSFLASVLSAATLLGGPVETYAYGTMYLYWIFAALIGTYFTVTLFIPMFHQIGNYSVYAYLEQRFSLTVRIVVTIIFILNNTIYIAVILYGPSLALSQVTGLDIWFAIGSCGIICTLYTSVGGMKAVIWTDVVQTIVMFLGLILSIIFGFIDVGGVKKVFEIAIDGNRIQLANMTFNLSIRYTVWSTLIGGGLYATAAFSCLQTQAQRYMCVKSTRDAQKVAWINIILMAIIYLFCGCIGCILYAKYNQCDPLQAKLISKPDQLYPLFVIETLGRFPGLTGLFIATILSASLSTISSGINSIVTVILEDIYKRLVVEHSMSDKRQAIISKILSVLIGLLIVMLAFLASYLNDNILVIICQFVGSYIPPILGIYLLGFFAPRVNSRNVLVALLLCLIFQTWILIGANLTAKQHIGRNGRLPTSIEGCLSAVNITQPITTSQSSNNPLLPLYSISVMWYAFNGVFLTIIFSLLGTFIFGSNNSKMVDESLLILWKNVFCPWCWTNKKSKDELCELDTQTIEQERML